MNEIFADTSGWGHLFDATQARHLAAANIYHEARQQKRMFVTTNYILTELVALMLTPLHLPHQTIVACIDGLKASSSLRIVQIDANIDAQAWRLFKERPDKAWSLVDCASFVVMRQLGIADALTTDRHFEQAGFVQLLK